MDLSKVINTYIDYRSKMQALGYASYIISWDSETEAPVGCLEERSKQVGVLSEMSYLLERSNEYIETVKKLYENLDSLEDVLKVEIKKVYKDLMNSLKVPMEELVEYSILISKAQSIWADAKVNNDYKKFEPILDEIIKFNKRYVKYLETDNLKGYNVLLDMYEEGMTKYETNDYRTDEYGCQHHVYLTLNLVVITPDIYFTPNGDGVNDKWMVEGIESAPNAHIMIYDRHSKLLYKSIASEFEGWDGNYNGHGMVQDDYWYVILIPETNETLSGHFTLKR